MGDPTLIIGNWKANKTEEEAVVWFDSFRDQLASLSDEWGNKQAVICPTYPLIPTLNKIVSEKEIPITIGAQDISEFGQGAYTGEVPSIVLQRQITFCIIGHSERRKYFNETDEILEKKVVAASLVSTPVFCVQSENTKIPESVRFVAFEPIEAIGTGKADTPEDGEKVAVAIKEKNKNVISVLYGGSVTSKNVSDFTKMPNISGVLVGGASLDPIEFASIIKQC